MAKINPWEYREVEYPAERRVFREPERIDPRTGRVVPAVDVPFTLRSLTLPEASKAGRQAQHYARMFAETDEAGNIVLQPDNSFRIFYTPPGPANLPVELQSDDLQDIAMLEAMQAPDQVGHPEERYAIGDLIGFWRKMPAVYRQANLWAKDLMEAVGLGKLPDPVSETRSPDPPSSSDTHTRNQSSTTEPHSGVSTNGRESRSDFSESAADFSEGSPENQGESSERLPAAI